MMPVIRRYVPGEALDYPAIVCNAKTKENQEPKLQSQVVLIRDGREFYRGDRESLPVRSTD
jgi:hypothetical protein